jgi:mannose-6-phosphate isomerase-like protein (cupin superfamily)
MSYTADTGEASAVAVPAASIHRVAMKSGTTASYVATGQLTRGEYGLYRLDMPPSTPGARGHFHRSFSEAFYVVDGRPTFYDGHSWDPGGPGDFLYIPEGGIHGFRNDSDEPVSMLIVFAPGVARERYFEELAEISKSGRTMTKADWDDLYARHDQVMVE